MIDAKVAGRDIVAATLAAPAAVTNLMEALHKSLHAVSAGKKRPAKAVAAPAAAKRKRA